MVQFDGFTTSFDGQRWAQKDHRGKVIFVWDRTKNAGAGGWVLDQSARALDGVQHGGAFAGLTGEELTRMYSRIPLGKIVLPVDLRSGGRVEENASLVAYLGFSGLKSGTVIPSVINGTAYFSLFGPNPKTIWMASSDIEVDEDYSLYYMVPKESQLLARAGPATIGRPLVEIGATFGPGVSDGKMKDYQLMLLWSGIGLSLESILTDKDGRLLVLEAVAAP